MPHIRGIDRRTGRLPLRVSRHHLPMNRTLTSPQPSALPWRGEGEEWRSVGYGYGIPIVIVKWYYPVQKLGTARHSGQIYLPAFNSALTSFTNFPKRRPYSM